MIKLSRMADYAVVLMTHLAQDAKRCEVPLSAHEISEATGIPDPTVSKLLKALSRGGLLTSTRGLHGGYTLAKGSTIITMADIISAVDGPISLTECINEEEKNCGIESFCPTRSGWHKINHKVREAFASVSLAEIAVPVMFGEPLEAKQR
ncbi:MAG: system Fe-S cluster assembly regulator [Rickettsiales bacterium]|jgi:FeS assembly SUF system regulator|nr:system Fe-S cluster assembly regulator [Rickettsiales bacterium]